MDNVESLTVDQLVIRSLLTQLGSQAANHALEIANRDTHIAKMDIEVKDLRSILDSMRNGVVTDA